MGKNLFTISSMLKREDFCNINGFNENINKGLEDWDFWIKMLKTGGYVKYLSGIHFFIE